MKPTTKPLPPALCTCSPHDAKLKRLLDAAKAAQDVGHGIFLIVQCTHGKEITYRRANLTQQDAAAVANYVLALNQDAEPVNPGLHAAKDANAYSK